MPVESCWEDCPRQIHTNDGLCPLGKSGQWYSPFGIGACHHSEGITVTLFLTVDFFASGGGGCIAPLGPGANHWLDGRDDTVAIRPHYNCAKPLEVHGKPGMCR